MGNASENFHNDGMTVHVSQMPVIVELMAYDQGREDLANKAKPGYDINNFRNEFEF